MWPATRTLVLSMIRHSKGVLSAVEAWVAAEDVIDYGHHRGLAGASAGPSATALPSPPRVTSTTVTRSDDDHG